MGTGRNGESRNQIFTESPRPRQLSQLPVLEVSFSNYNEPLNNSTFIKNRRKREEVSQVLSRLERRTKGRAEEGKGGVSGVMTIRKGRYLERTILKTGNL